MIQERAFCTFEPKHCILGVGAVLRCKRGVRTFEPEHFLVEVGSRERF